MKPESCPQNSLEELCTKGWKIKINQKKDLILSEITGINQLEMFCLIYYRREQKFYRIFYVVLCW